MQVLDGHKPSTGEPKKLWAGVGGRIRERRMALGMEQEELAALSHVSTRTISAYENEETNPTRKIEDLAFALQVSRDWLWYGHEHGLDASSPVVRILEELKVNSELRDQMLADLVETNKQILEEIRKRPLGE